MLNGLKDRIVKMSSSAKRITVSGLSKLNFSTHTFTSKTRAIILSSTGVVAAAAIALNIVLSAGTTVMIFDGDNAGKTVTTKATYVEDILSAEGIVLGAKDKMNVLPRTLLEDDMKIEIQRAYKVTVTDKGVTKEHMTLATTTGALLDEYGYDYKESDKISPALDQSIEANTNITLIHTEEKTETVSEEIPFDSTERTNSSLAKGKKKTIQQGKPGEKTVSYKVYYEDGVEVSRKKIEETVVVEAIEHITEIGTKKSAPVVASAKSGNGSVKTSRSGNLAYSRVLTLNATGYDASSCGKSPSHPGYGITATGARAVYGVVAVDPSIIPLGSRLYIETADGSFIYGTAVAADTGGAIKGNRIDLCFNTRQEALNFGRRQVKVYILK
ncbi:MAG: G5 domain-containing protein [Clostridia bacterium]|nr:G5 domain-containing protein [Clostridia bacterium]